MIISQLSNQLNTMLTDLNDIYYTRGSPEPALLIQLFVHWLFFENFFYPDSNPAVLKIGH